MKTILTFILSVLLLPCFAQNMVVNGDFEDHLLNTVVGMTPQCYSSISSAFMPTTPYWEGFWNFSYYNITGTCDNGGAFNWLYEDCPIIIDTTGGVTSWGDIGEDPPSGTHYVLLAAYNLTTPREDVLNFSLNSIVEDGNWYKLSYYIKYFPQLPSLLYQPHGDNTQLKFSLGNDSLCFGNQILHTSVVPDSVWTKQTVVFQANANYDFLSLKTCVIDTGTHAVLLDNIVLTTDTATSVQEYVQEPKLVRIVDMLGRETQPKKNTPLFYLFDDGTVEKRLVIE